MDIGTNAGVIWRALYEEKQGMTLNALMARVNLPMFEVMTAIGWLARENKIWLSGDEDSNLHLTVFQDYYY